MTFQEIKASLAAAGKPVADAQLYRYFRAFDIKPAGWLTRPRNYPADSADKILRQLGFPNGSAGGLRSARTGRPLGLISLPVLKRAVILSRQLRPTKNQKPKGYK